VIYGAVILYLLFLSQQFLLPRPVVLPFGTLFRKHLFEAVARNPASDRLGGVAQERLDDVKGPPRTGRARRVLREETAPHDDLMASRGLHRRRVAVDDWN
jgi:hypothetical protein